MAKAKSARSLRHWLARTGSSQTDLRALVERKTGHSISKSAMSAILTGAHRCSLPRALALSKATGVAVENLSAGLSARSRQIFEQPVENQVQK